MQECKTVTIMNTRQYLEAILPGRSKDELDVWYEAIYGNPDMTEIDEIMQGLVDKIQWKDVNSLSKSFQDDAMEVVKAVSEYFWKLLDLPVEGHEVLTYADYIELCRLQSRECEVDENEGALMMYEYFMNDAGETTNTFLLVNKRLISECTLATLLYAIPHESWHAWQRNVKQMGVAGRKVYIPLSGGPDEVSRATLYYLNFLMQVNPEEDEEAYRQQLIEKEAFWFADKVHQRVQELITEMQDVAVAERFNCNL